MALAVAKLEKRLFQSDDGLYTVYRARIGGKSVVAVVRGEDPPKAHSQANWLLNGEWVKHPRYGRQFEVKTATRQARAIPRETYNRTQSTTTKDAQ